MVLGAHVGAQSVALTISEQPLDAVTNVGGVAAFKVAAAGVGPLTFQWLRNGQEIHGATHAILVLDVVRASDAGAYHVTIADNSGSISSRTATLRVDPPPAQPIVDPEFRADLRLNSTPTAVLPLPDGRVVVAPAWDQRIVRLRSDGSIDPTFTPGRLEPPFGSTETTVYQLIPEPEGRLLVTGGFAAYEQRPAPGLMRLNPDGTRDDSLVVPADLEFPFVGTGDPTRRVAVQADGKILVLTARGLVRLLRDGSRDTAFAPAVGVNNNIGAFALTSGDRIYVGLNREQAVARLLPSGAEDPEFERQPAETSASMKLHVLADGRLLVNTAHFIPARPVTRVFWTLVRWFENGSLDFSFARVDRALVGRPAEDGALFFPDGTLVAPDGSSRRLNLGFGQFDGPMSASHMPAVFAPDGKLYAYGSFAFHHGVTSPRIVRLNRVPSGAREVEQPPRILATWADAPVVTLGQSTMLRVAAVAPGPVTYEWRQVNPDGSLATTRRTNAPVLEFTPRYLVERGNWTVRVLNSAGEATSAPIAITLRAAELRIVSEPERVTLAPGRLASVLVEVSRYSDLREAVWRRNGMEIARAFQAAPRYPYTTFDGTNLLLELGPATTDLAGTYDVVVTSSTGAVARSRPIEVALADQPRFVNLSTRAFVGEGEHAVVLGFVIPPGPSRTLFVRGVGPTLAQLGVEDALADARLELFDSSGRRMSHNDHWREHGSGTDFAAIGAFPLPPDSKDAMLANGGLPPGAYTLRLSGPAGVTGIGLVELYEKDNRSERFVNLSTRVSVREDAPAIAGFVIRGPGLKRVLVRAAGPALAAFGISRSLDNPRLELRSERGTVVAANDDWSQPVGAPAVARAAAAAGAFPFVEGSRDAALLVDLPDGVFTAVVTGAAARDSGIALLEIYEVP